MKSVDLHRRIESQGLLDPLVSQVAMRAALLVRILHGAGVRFAIAMPARFAWLEGISIHVARLTALGACWDSRRV